MRICLFGHLIFGPSSRIKGASHEDVDFIAVLEGDVSCLPNYEPDLILLFLDLRYVTEGYLARVFCADDFSKAFQDALSLQLVRVGELAVLDRDDDLVEAFDLLGVLDYPVLQLFEPLDDPIRLKSDVLKHQLAPDVLDHLELSFVVLPLLRILIISLESRVVQMLTSLFGVLSYRLVDLLKPKLVAELALEQLI